MKDGKRIVFFQFPLGWLTEKIKRQKKKNKFAEAFFFLSKLCPFPLSHRMLLLALLTLVLLCQDCRGNRGTEAAHGWGLRFTQKLWPSHTEGTNQPGQKVIHVARTLQLRSFSAPRDPWWGCGCHPVILCMSNAEWVSTGVLHSLTWEVIYANPSGMHLFDRRHALIDPALNTMWSAGEKKDRRENKTILKSITAYSLCSAKKMRWEISMETQFKTISFVFL